jgi:hypothetical protein
MEPIILMNSKWGNDLFVPMYLFFGGLSGGLFVVAVAADLLGINISSACTCISWSFHFVSPWKTGTRNFVSVFL